MSSSRHDNVSLIVFITWDLQVCRVTLVAYQRKTTACTLRIDRNLQWHRAVSPRQHGLHRWMVRGWYRNL